MNYPERKNMRLKGYDYSQKGGYFLTICTDRKRCILSKVCTAKDQRPAVVLENLGRLVHRVIHETAKQYGVMIDECVIMPNHIHMLIFLDEHSQISVGRFVGAVKSITANQWRKYCESVGVDMGKIWQRDYYDHILRNELDYLEKRRYIDENPDKWMLDDMYGDDNS